MNWAEFFAMKGYALYVWGSFGISVLVFAVEIILVRHRRKLALRQVRLMQDNKDQESS